MTPAQERAFAEHWPQYGLEAEDTLLDLPEIFGRRSEIGMDIGYGKGESLLAMAEAHPEQDFIGVEVHRPGVGHLMNEAAKRELGNIRVIVRDAVEVLEKQIADGSLERVFIFFSDPWHKKRHHKRRLIQADFIALLARKLKSGGELFLATDWQNYAEQMLEVMSAAEAFDNTCPQTGYAPRYGHRPLTKFEKRGKRLGHDVWDLHFIRK